MPLNHASFDVHATLLQLLEAGRPVALLTILKSAGSTPRKAGTKAIVAADGTLWGTIGGGVMEAKAREAGIEAMASGLPSVLEFGFQGGSAAENRPICGGTMRVLVDPTVAQHRDAFAAAVAAARDRREGVLITSVVGSPAARVEVRFAAEGSEPEAGLLEPVLPAPRLIIAGGGHVGQALACQALLVGLEVIVIEDRSDFSSPGRYPAGVQTRCGDGAAEIQRIGIDSQTYIAIVNRGHLQDSAVLAACIASPARYIGMMGSRRKVALVRKEFLESGKATAEQLARVHAPIGLDIGAETVEEIAASIVAELIQARRGTP